MATIFFGKFLGIFFTILGLGFFFNREHAKKIASDFEKSPASVFCAGIISLLLGIWVVLFHNIWIFDWRILVTLVGWYLLLSGVFRIMFVDAWTTQIVKLKAQHLNLHRSIILIVGLLLLYVGFFLE